MLATPNRSAFSTLSSIFPYMLAMAAVVIASNFLVQFPVHYDLGPFVLSDLLTWGAFTYPIAFLVTDLSNRHFGPAKARLIVTVGFILAVAISIYVASPRIAIASGTAFILAQFLDVSIFDRLRHSRWWHAPLLSSALGSVLDTILFFTLAFAASLSPQVALLGAGRSRRQAAGVSGHAGTLPHAAGAVSHASRRRYLILGRLIRANEIQGSDCAAILRNCHRMPASHGCFHRRPQRHPDFPYYRSGIRILHQQAPHRRQFFPGVCPRP